MGYFRTRWWFLAVFIVVLAVYSAVGESGPVRTLVNVFLVAYPVLIVAGYWHYAHSQENKIFFVGRYYKIDREKLVGVLNDGTESTIRKEHFVRAVRGRRFYLLYLSARQFIFLPRTSFQSESDIRWFREEFLSGIKE